MLEDKPEWEDTLTSEEDFISQSLDSIEKLEPKAAKKEPEATEASSGVKEGEYSKDDLLRVFDSLMFEGVYQEDFKIGSRYTVTLRTRSVQESNNITQYIDRKEFRTIMAVQNFTNFIVLTYAVTHYCGKDIGGLKWEDRYNFLKSLPEMVISAISKKLYDFDKKVSAAMEEGGENF